MRNKPVKFKNLLHYKIHRIIGLLSVIPLLCFILVNNTKFLQFIYNHVIAKSILLTMGSAYISLLLVCLGFVLKYIIPFAYLLNLVFFIRRKNPEIDYTEMQIFDWVEYLIFHALILCVIFMALNFLPIYKHFSVF